MECPFGILDPGPFRHPYQPQGQRMGFRRKAVGRLRQAMHTLDTDTRLEKIADQEFRAFVSPRWEVWGPNGGYLAAIALRAAGEVAPGFLPVSFSCQYLNVANFEDVLLQVQCLKSGKTSRALQVSMTQNGKVILQALVWVATANDGLEHDFLPVPASWYPLAGLPDCEPKWGYKFWDNFSIRSIQPNPDDKRKGIGGIAANWFRYVPEFKLQDPFLNAARSVILIDTLQWPAAVMAHDAGSLSHFAPSLNLNVHFHNPTSPSAWLFCEARSNYAGRGLIDGSARVWDIEGRVLASGGSQSICRRMGA